MATPVMTITAPSAGNPSISLANFTPPENGAGIIFYTTSINDPVLVYQVESSGHVYYASGSMSAIANPSFDTALTAVILSYNDYSTILYTFTNNGDIIVNFIDNSGGGGDGGGGGGGGGGTGVITFPFILQQDAGANLDVAGETVTNNLVPHVYLDYYGIDFAQVFIQQDQEPNRVVADPNQVLSMWANDVSGFISDVEQSLRTFNKWLGGYDHREFESTACTQLEGLADGLAKLSFNDYTSNIFEQLVGIDASSVSLDASGVMTFDFTNINEFHIVSRVSTAYSISVDNTKAFSISGMPAEITIDYASASPVSATRPWYVLTRIHRAEGTNTIQYDSTGTAPDA